MPQTPTLPITPGATALLTHWEDDIDAMARRGDIDALRHERDMHALSTVSSVMAGETRSAQIFAGLATRAEQAAMDLTRAERVLHRPADVTEHLAGRDA